jgi:hypothetical protein
VQQRLTELRAEYGDAGAGSTALSPTSTARCGPSAAARRTTCRPRARGQVGEKSSSTTYLGFRAGAAESEAAIRQAIAELRRDGRPNHDDAVRLAEGCARGRLTKFQPCLPPRLESELLAEVLTDDEAARLAIGNE